MQKLKLKHGPLIFILFLIFHNKDKTWNVDFKLEREKHGYLNLKCNIKTLVMFLIFSKL
jgi:hypothetical protein